MSSTSLSLARRVLVTAALGLFVIILLLVSQLTVGAFQLPLDAVPRWELSEAWTKSKWWLALLAIIPISILALFTIHYARRSESVDLAAELPLPVVAVRRTRAPDTTVTSLLRAWQCLPTPSPQGLHTIASRYTTVFDRTLSRSYLFKNAFHYLVDVRLAPSPGTRASTATVLSGLREREAVVSTLQRLASPLEPGLLVDQRLTSVERLAIHPPQDLVDSPSVSSTCGDYPSARTPSAAALPTSRATSPASAISITAPPNTKGSAALLSTLPSILLTHPDQTKSEVIFDVTSGYVDDKTKDLEPARNPGDPRHSTVSLASSVSDRVPQTSVLGVSTLAFPSLPGPAEDDELTITNADSLVSKRDAMNALGIVLSESASRIVSVTGSLGRANCAIDVISVPFKRSRKAALKGPNILNHAEWSRKPLDDVATAVVHGGATITLPHLIDTPTSTPSPSSDDGKLSSSWPIPTPSTPPTSIDLQLDHEPSAGTPNSTFDSTFKPTSYVQVLDAEATVQDAPEGKVEEAVAWWRPNVPFKVVQGPRLDRHRHRGSRYNASKSSTDEDWKWAKTEGKKPVGGRRPLVVTKPAPPNTFVAPDAVDDECGEDDFGEEELQKAILMSMGMVPEDCEADAEASPNSKHFGSELIEVPLAPPPPYIPSEPPAYVDRGGFPVGDLEKALQESKSEVQTTVLTMGVEDDLDKDGFSKSQQERAREASRKALMTPFYGATTSHAPQPLSEEQWALLEEFEATSSN